MSLLYNLGKIRLFYPVLNPSRRAEMLQVMVINDKCQRGLTLTFVCVNLLYPGEGVDFHQGVRNADHMHPIHDALP